MDREVSYTHVHTVYIYKYSFVAGTAPVVVIFYLYNNIDLRACKKIRPAARRKKKKNLIKNSPRKRFVYYSHSYLLILSRRKKSSDSFRILIRVRMNSMHVYIYIYIYPIVSFPFFHPFFFIFRETKKKKAKTVFSRFVQLRVSARIDCTTIIGNCTRL